MNNKQLVQLHKNNIDNKNPKILPFNVAILIHVYDSLKITNDLILSILTLLKYYDKSNFDWYVNIGESDNVDKLFELIKSKLDPISKRLTIISSPNRGGDIGGFIRLVQTVTATRINYKYCFVFHTKTSDSWRKSLVNDIIKIKLEKLIDFYDIGIVGSKQHIHNFKYTSDSLYAYHIKSISKRLAIPVNYGEEWLFVGGTIFLVNYKIISFLGTLDLNGLYSDLNTVDTIDQNWRDIVIHKFKKNTKNTNNDYHYRKLYGCSLQSDYMIEHTFERFIGYISKYLNLKTYGN